MKQEQRTPLLKSFNSTIQMASVQTQKPAQQSDHVQPSTVTTQKTNKSHQSCRERVKVMANKMFHHDQAQIGNQASNGQGHQPGAKQGNPSANQASAKTKKETTTCMPKIREHMKNKKKRKSKEGRTGDKSDNSSSSDESDREKGTTKKG